MDEAPYDALLLVSFGGPEGPDEVMPFLENVVAGRNVPRARLEGVAQHYLRFGGVSPINEQNRRLIAALAQELAEHGPKLPIFWGNRNWHPLLADTLREMAGQGVRRALAFVTSAFSSYSGCRQYREDIARAQEQVGPAAPAVDKLRVFFNHPGFVEAQTERVADALGELPAGVRDESLLLFTAHSIPQAMADNCRYEEQLREACRLVAEAAGQGARWRLVYQSRSGPPQQPWLEPDVCDVIRELAGGESPTAELSERAARPAGPLVIVPIGFVSDHMEVIYDLDVEARELCDALGVTMVRAGTVGTHPRFVQMIRELMVERMTGAGERPAVGNLPASHDVCPEDCCLYTPRRPGGQP